MTLVPDSRPVRPAEPNGSGTSPALAELAERLRTIASNATAPEDVLEPALQAMVEATGAGAGALCLFDPRQEVLRLAAEVGLSDEGCRRLRGVRRGDAGGWDMPLHGLLNRRAYLIDSASRNRYVPPLCESAAEVRTVACLPLYAGVTPLGSLVLVTLTPRSFGERDIRQFEPSLRELVKMIEAVRRRATLGIAPAKAVAPPAETIPRPAAEAAADAERVETLVASLAESERERDRLAAALEAASAELAEKARLQEALEATRAAERAAEVERLTIRLAAAEAALVPERERVRELEEERARLAEEQGAAVARERGAAEERVAEALGAKRAAEEAAAAAAAEVERAHADCAGAQTLAAGLRDELGRAQEEIARLRAEAEGETAVGAHDAEAAARLATLESELAGLHAERDGLREAVAALTAERDELRAALAAAAAERRGPAEAPRVADGAAAPAEPAGATDTSPPAGEVAGAVPAPASGRGPAQIVVVVDVDGAWASAAVNGFDVVLLSPGEDIGGRLEELVPSRVVVNLAAPGALEAIASARSAGCRTRFWGCVAAAGAARAVPLGMIEPAQRPLDPDAIVAALAGYATRGTRVVTIGADVDALVSLRQAMARQGMSVSMAWDAKQAGDLLVMVKPQVVVVDLTSQRESSGLVLGLGAVDPVPNAVLIPGEADTAKGFAASLADPHAAARSVPLERLLANVVRGSETPSAEDGRTRR